MQPNLSCLEAGEDVGRDDWRRILSGAKDKESDPDRQEETSDSCLNH